MRLAALAILIPLASCGALSTECTLVAVAAVNVSVFDAAGARVCTAHVVAKSATREEVLQVSGPDGDCTYFGLYEVSGAVTITATSARFPQQLTKTVTIERDACHVLAQAVELRAP